MIIFTDKDRSVIIFKVEQCKIVLVKRCIT